MALVQEPISFAYKDKKEGEPTITLLINPETLTLNFKKVITRTRTKSRIVSFYWGQEPVSFSYAGQTGNMWPGNEIRDNFINTSTASIANNFSEIEKQKETAEYLYNHTINDIYTLTQLYGTDNSRVKEAEEAAESYRNEITTLNASLSALSNGMDNLSSDNYSKLGFGENYITDKLLQDKKHTDVLKMSPKYQKFEELRKFYGESQNINRLVRVKYRDWVLDGYFESFGFTDSALSPWNWKYTLAFTVLNWDKTTSGSGYLSTVQNRETVLVADPEDSNLGGFQRAGFIT